MKLKSRLPRPALPACNNSQTIPSFFPFKAPSSKHGPLLSTSYSIGWPIANVHADVNRAILLIDRDLGFSFWLGKALDQAGYQAFPARTVSDAFTLLSDLSLNLCLLILCRSPEGADELVALLRMRNQDLRVVCLSEDGDFDHLPLGAPDAFYQKPAGRSENDLAELLRAIARVFERGGRQTIAATSSAALEPWLTGR